MRCEWDAKNQEAKWWALTIFGPRSWCCDECLKRVGKKNDAGDYIAMPAEQKLAEIHKAG